eukprot:GILI01020514.1.p1 GENE.GILI01020514.1~~GILI01020514.1.p1  ORF type:complete len:155 (+),score=32.83 GILI01020514.1:142-606(+)
MDHHCPWINNCVGHFNHQYFILFLTYLWMGTGFVSLIGTPFFIQASAIGNPNDAIFIFVYILSGVMFLVLFFFAGMHWLFVLRGETTIEFMSNYFDSSSTTAGHIYNLGYKDNLKVVFGTDRIAVILLPIRRRLSLDGHHWPNCLDTYEGDAAV